MAAQISAVKHSPKARKKKAPMVNHGFDDEHFITVPKSTFYKRTLRKEMYRKEAIKTAKTALNWHKAEAHHIEKYIERAFNQARYDFIVDSSDSDCAGCHPIKKQRQEDEEMDKE